MTFTNRKLSRRAVLRGAGGIMVGLPFLSAMIPARARAQALNPKRFVLLFSGTCQPHGGLDQAAQGALPATLPRPWLGLDPVRQHASVVARLRLPTYNNNTPEIPGGAININHNRTRAPILSGNRSVEIMINPIGGHSVDQIAVDAIGAGTRLSSLQACVQAAGYGYGGPRALVSARRENGSLRALDPIFSPQLIFSTLFNGFTPPGGGGGTTTPPPPSLAERKQKSVLDAVLADANRLTNSVGGQDRARLEQHFEEIRALERRLFPMTPPGMTPPPSNSACAVPSDPGADPAIQGGNTFGGWNDETGRGDLMVDLIAMALACDITRAVTLTITFDQSGLSSQTITGKSADMHEMSHNQGGGTPQDVQDNGNWHVERFARLVGNLSQVTEGTETLLDNTFVTYVSAESNNAHGKSNFTFAFAGRPSVVKAGQLINAGDEHPARMMMGGLAAVGVNVNTMGEVGGGPLTGMMV